MGLDKWLKPGETEKKSKKQKASPDQVKISKVEGEQTTSPKKSSSKLTKFTLVCSSVKCKYQKTIMKKQLTEIDRICPRCNKEMKVK